MSALECDKNGCDNVMCDRLSGQYGYICNECYDELVLLGVSTNIKAFMSMGSPKKLVRQEQASEAYFNTIFGIMEEHEQT